MKKEWSTLALVLLCLIVFACEEPEEYSPLGPDIEEPKLKESTIGVSTPEIDSENGGGRIYVGDEYCYKGNRLEFDVYDSDMEFTNPKNYQVILSKTGGNWKGKRHFSQYCTQNNTVAFYGLTPGTYSYKLTSSCTSKAYNGRFIYNGGYQAQILHIDQSLCD